VTTRKTTVVHTNDLYVLREISQIVLVQEAVNNANREDIRINGKRPHANFAAPENLLILMGLVLAQNVLKGK
jgi:hypothetical protein